MAFPYFPHARKVVVTIDVEGHQMNRISRTITLTTEEHGAEITGQFADVVLSAMDLAVANRPVSEGKDAEKLVGTLYAMRLAYAHATDGPARL